MSHTPLAYAGDLVNDFVTLNCGIKPVVVFHLLKISQRLAMFWGAFVCSLILSQGLIVKPAGFKLSLYSSLASHLQLS